MSACQDACLHYRAYHPTGPSCNGINFHSDPDTPQENICLLYHLPDSFKPNTSSSADFFCYANKYYA